MFTVTYTTSTSPVVFTVGTYATVKGCRIAIAARRRAFTAAGASLPEFRIRPVGWTGE